ncbi:MAG: 2-amino-4-hydroxy-6-hydroxymethyldihydropteridine diphosphokinase [Campylobacterota bacterium]|nr:2-amino-4-hydroxy-6-hydroxymethyldihydropteridine diphosphokinase [Campylobacterota bacterium]
MKKKIDDKLTLFYNNLYPYKSKNISKKKNTVTIGIGGNVGNVVKTFKKLFICLNKNSNFHIIKTAPILKNPPFGYKYQEYFFNSIIVLKTDLNPQRCLKVFQRYENRFKRERSFKDAPRTLDIDIIFFNLSKIDTKDLIIPHIGYKSRDSVRIPLKLLK